MKKITRTIYSFIKISMMILLLLTNKKITAQSQNALDFDGTDDYVSAPGGSQLINGAGLMSLTMWVYPVNPVIGFPDFDGFAGIRNNLDADFYILQYSATEVEARFRNSAGQNFDIVHGGLQLNTWQHYALTYDNVQLRLYLNGQPIDSIAAAGVIINTAEPFYIGDLLYTGTDYYLQGKMDEVSLWNRMLLPDEINCIYHNGIDSADANLKLYYKFNQGIAGGNNAGVTTLIDSKGNSNGTLNNFTLSGPSSNWVAGVFNNISISDTICQGDSYVFGSQTLTEAGIYYQHFPLASGCDSVIELNLSVTSVDTSVTQNGVTLTSNQAGATYQWLDCHIGLAIIPGATSQTYNPIFDGSYAVAVTVNNCTDTSACYLVTGVGISEDVNSAYLSVFPNPADKRLSIDLGKTQKNVSILITDAKGREILNTVYPEMKSSNFNTSVWRQGIYILKITSENMNAVVKVVKK
ncbi:MAG TPA: LamG-like jellyroll fold domain-containing protein [Bacteroidia bacterium]|nr:LamG-like jellyroll fold domain-containing protein [Bacteroidia bacterium]